MPIDTTVEAPDVPEAPKESDGGTVGTQNAVQPFHLSGYKHGGKVNLSDCKVSTHEKNKSSPNW
jgi:hypothetical protein